MRRPSKWLIVAFLTGLAWALRKPRELPEADAPAPKPVPSPEPPPEPTPPEAEPMPASVAWVEPNADGSCPLTHPVKLKASSSIYHVEGQRHYERTRADRCYLSPDAAEADGHRSSKT
ncbi:MAG: hypothetical protein GY745_08230 [Actinomycetia bacterium]|nr:hypothetical protein [Actinomycetes bacterium]MCP3913105.1 hypothetical protein [Actinomycetes bacterium]MCP4085022.1 hypothetical protein [Actinomycetes bacterium]